MRRKFPTTLYLFLTILILIVAGVVYQIWNKPHPNIRDAVAVKITAVALYDSLANNRTPAKTSFINKVVAVSGKIKEIILNQEKKQVVLLLTNKNGASVNCTMEEMVEGISKGDKITIKGLCMGYSGGDASMDLPGDVYLTRCYRF